MKIQESLENYLETIYVLQKANGEVRSIDVANELGFSKPSVSVAVKKMKEQEYIEVSTAGLITLTEKGVELAKRIYERHTILTEILVKLGVSNNIAKEDACRIEHVISEESFQCIKNVIDKK